MSEARVVPIASTSERTMLGAALALAGLALLILVLAPRAGAVACEIADTPSYGCAETNFTWLNATGANTTLTLGDDASSSAIALPFNFTFFNATETAATVGSNGVVCFNAANCSLANPPSMPNATSPNELIGCFWEDLNATAGGTVTYFTNGTAPNRTFVVQFNGVPHKNSTTANNTFQFHLAEKGEVRCSLSNVTADNDGNNTALGIEDANGTSGLSYKYANFSAANLTVRFTPKASAPLNLTANASSSTARINLTWSAPTRTAGYPILSYGIYRGTSSGNETLLAQPAGNATNYTDTSLANGTKYYYKVSATTLAGEGVLGSEANATTPGLAKTVPDAPTDLSVVAGPGSGKLTLSWQAPANDGGSDITVYRIYRSNATGNETFLANQTATNGTFLDSGLGNNVTRFYKVSAVNDVGEGALSSEASGTTARLPGAPRSLAAQSGPGVGQITVTWQAPSDTGGLAVAFYTVYRGSSAGNESTALPAGSATTFVDRDLQSGSTWFYQVSATTGAGEGARSGEVNATANVTRLPDAPGNLTASAGPGGGNITLAWDAPAGNGGSAITNYTIYRKNGTSGTEALLARIAPLAPTYRDGGLPRGTSFTYRVAAVNSVGEGNRSNAANATTLGVPGAPRTLTVTVGASGDILVRWQTPVSDGGSPVRGYVVYRANSTGNEDEPLARVGNTTTYTDTSVAPGATRFYKVSAFNDAGEGPQSIEDSARAPGQPTTTPTPTRAGGNGLPGFEPIALLGAGLAAVTALRRRRA